ncbi:pirin family protein [Salinicola avicenniae]|uniref:pirin family protein n=1 Tax=Salinicola avicenniae TaxID=2916836 RepID=UPI002074A0AE|nr:MULTISPECIES: pirin family protein [unclassified Salinicola]
MSAVDIPTAPRRIVALHSAIRDDIGDLVTRRPLPGARLSQLDPFLFLNHHGPQVYPANNRGLPFGPHPHRGFETVTFILEGSLAHADSADHQSVIYAGGVQWMTAGSGIVHAEVSPAEFLRDGGPLEILQLWINLPAALKMSEPRYIGLQREGIPALALPGGGELNLVAGAFAGRTGPIETLTDVFLSTVTLPRGADVTLPVSPGRQLFLYVVEGEIDVAGRPACAHQLVELDREGDSLAMAATADARLIVGHAEVIGEPTVSHGPFVMNTREEIEQAVDDYRAGRFGGLAQ